MTHIIDILTIATFGIALIGGGIRAVSKLTRIADSVDRLSASVEGIGGKLDNHEQRITDLETVRPRARTRAN